MFSLHQTTRRLLLSSRILVYRNRGCILSKFIRPMSSTPRITPKKLFKMPKINASFWSNENAFLHEKRILDMSLSEMAGNLSYVFVMCAYTMTDILSLRLCSISGTLLGILFLYYRKIPMWIPIRWNFLLLFINSFMVARIYLENKRANEMSKDMEALYRHGLFESRGFSKVEFLRFHELASTVTLPPERVIVKKGEPKHSLYFLLSGNVLIKKNGETIANLDKHIFIGEVSLLGKMCQGMDTGASADVVVGSRPATFLRWDFDALIPYLKKDREVFNALSAYLNYDLTAKLLGEGRDGLTQKATTKMSLTTEPVNRKDEQE